MGVRSVVGGILKVAAPVLSVVPGVGPLASLGAGIAGDALSGAGTRGAINAAQRAQENAITEATGGLQGSERFGQEILRNNQRGVYEQQLGVLDRTRGLNDPFIQGGQNAFMSLSDMDKRNPEFNFDPSQVTHSPVFEQAFNDAIKSLNRSAAGKSRLFSGGTAKELLDYGKKISIADYAGEFGRQFDTATQRYNAGRQNVQDLYNRFLGLSDIGERATGRVGQAEQHFGDEVSDVDTRTSENIANLNRGTAEDVANLAIGRGDVRASGYLGRNQATNQTINNIGDRIGDYISFRKVRAGSGARPPYPGATPPFVGDWEDYGMGRRT